MEEYHEMQRKECLLLAGRLQGGRAVRSGALGASVWQREYHRHRHHMRWLLKCRFHLLPLLNQNRGKGWKYIFLICTL